MFYGQFVSQHLHDSTLLALGAPFPASCVHVCHFEFHCQSAYLHCFHPDNSASVLLFLSVSRFFPCHVSLFSKDTAACFNKKLAYFNRLPPFVYQNIKVALFIPPCIQHTRMYARTRIAHTNYMHLKINVTLLLLKSLPTFIGISLFVAELFCSRFSDAFSKSPSPPLSPI